MQSVRNPAGPDVGSMLGSGDGSMVGTIAVPLGRQDRVSPDPMVTKPLLQVQVPAAEPALEFGGQGLQTFVGSLSQI